MKLTRILAAAALFAFAGSAEAQVQLNELFISHTGTDNREFIEVRGPAGTALTGHMLLVLEGDATSNQGSLDIAIDLSAGTINANGLYTVGSVNVVPAVDQIQTGPGSPPDVNLFENGTNTFYLIHTTNVAGVLANLGTDLRIGGAGTVTTLTTDPAITILDLVGLQDSATEPIFDGAPAFMDGTFGPAGVQRCGDAPFGWNPRLLNFNFPTLPPTASYDDPTPGAANPNCVVVPPVPGTLFCPGDGTGTACPCANSSPAGNNEGCLNSLLTGGKLRAVYNAGEPTTGPSLLADGDGTPQISLNGSQMPNSSCLYFQGTTQQNGGLGSAFGDGLRCAGGSVIRLDTEANSGGASAYPNLSQPLSISVRGVVTSPGTRTYQAWYRNADPTYCTPSTFNVSNGLELVWGA